MCCLSDTDRCAEAEVCRESMQSMCAERVCRVCVQSAHSCAEAVCKVCMCRVMQFIYVFVAVCVVYHAH
jgi:hypothetical protein